MRPTRSRHAPMIHLLGYPAPIVDIGFGIFAGFLLVRLGHSVLGLLRDIDDYRANRRSQPIQKPAAEELEGLADSPVSAGRVT
jgi:hypothetical protein